MAVDGIELGELCHIVPDGLAFFRRGFTVGDVSGALFTLEGACVVFVSQDHPKENDDAERFGELYVSSPDQALRTVADDDLAKETVANFLSNTRPE